MPLSANLLKLESSILPRAKRATNRNNVATEQQIKKKKFWRRIVRAPKCPVPKCPAPNRRRRNVPDPSIVTRLPVKVFSFDFCQITYHVILLLTFSNNFSRNFYFVTFSNNFTRAFKIMKHQLKQISHYFQIEEIYFPFDYETNRLAFGS